MDPPAGLRQIDPVSAQLLLGLGTGQALVAVEHEVEKLVPDRLPEPAHITHNRHLSV